MENNTAPVTIAIADDHPMLREGFANMFKHLPKVRIVASVANGKELVKAVSEYEPRVVFTDIRMPVLDGVEATRTIKAKFPNTKVIALSAYDEYYLVTEMITVGANAYLLKNAAIEEIIQAIKAVLSGQTYYSAEIAKKVEDYLNKKQRKPIKNIAFTEREIEVMQLITDGKTSKQIAARLGISVRTIETHRHSLEKKIGTKNVMGIALYAVRHGYME